jgi:hypothetical protein
MRCTCRVAFSCLPLMGVARSMVRSAGFLIVPPWRPALGAACWAWDRHQVDTLTALSRKKSRCRSRTGIGGVRRIGCSPRSRSMVCGGGRHAVICGDRPLQRLWDCGRRLVRPRPRPSPTCSNAAHPHGPGSARRWTSMYSAGGASADSYQARRWMRFHRDMHAMAAHVSLSPLWIEDTGRGCCWAQSPVWKPSVPDLIDCGTCRVFDTFEATCRFLLSGGQRLRSRLPKTEPLEEVV